MPSILYAVWHTGRLYTRNWKSVYCQYAGAPTSNFYHTGRNFYFTSHPSSMFTHPGHNGVVNGVVCEVCKNHFATSWFIRILREIGGCRMGHVQRACLWCWEYGSLFQLLGFKGVVSKGLQCTLLSGKVRESQLAVRGTFALVKTMQIQCTAKVTGHTSYFRCRNTCLWHAKQYSAGIIENEKYEVCARL